MVQILFLENILCKSFCRVNHYRFNARRMASTLIQEKFQDILDQTMSYSCKDCDLTFETCAAFYDHIESKHEEERETESWGSDDCIQNPCFSSGGNVKD